MAKSEGSIIRFETEDAANLLAIIRDNTKPRNVKEAALKRIREIERQTGRRLYGEYNASRNPSEMARVEEECAFRHRL